MGIVNTDFQHHHKINKYVNLNMKFPKKRNIVKIYNKMVNVINWIVHIYTITNDKKNNHKKLRCVNFLKVQVN